MRITRKISLVLIFFALATVSAQALAAPVIYDARECDVNLTPKGFAKLISDAPSRRSLGEAGTFVPGESSAKLLDVEGKDKRALSEAIINRLNFRADQKTSPYLQPVLETALKLASQMEAVFSISSWVMPDTGLRTIRMSLDMSGDSDGRLQVIRLPNMDIRNGALARRIDIDLSPERLTVLTGSAQALRGQDTLIVSEPASHSRGLEINLRDPQHPVFDAGIAPVEQFIGADSHPQLSGLLTFGGDLLHGVLPKAQDLRFRTDDQIKAVDYGSGWQVPH